MFTKNAFVVLGFVMLFCSCGDKKNGEEVVVEILNKEFINSTMLISNNTLELYKEIESNLHDPISKEKASFWQPKSNKIKYISESVHKYIDSVSHLEKTDWDLVSKNLKIFSKMFMMVDEEIGIVFNEKILKLSYPFDSLDRINNKVFFNNLSKAIKKSLQLKIISSVRILENEMVRFCFYKSKAFRCMFFTQFGVLVGQNTNHLRKGDVLEISAGVGAFSSEAKPQIIIANKNIEVSNGQARFKMKVNSDVGKHVIPVEISFTDPDGRVMKSIQEVEYTIDK
jgi:hypothetical protein